MAKAPALSTQLKVAQARIADLEKKLLDESSRCQSARVLADERAKEIEQINQVLDALPNPISRKTEHEESWRQAERTSVTRLAAWLASRN